jgi:hypothetical protein
MEVLLMVTAEEKRDSLRKSDGLTRIVAVVYGVALTQALTKNPDIVLHPLTLDNQITALALLAAAVLGGYAFFQLHPGRRRPLQLRRGLDSR